MENNNIHLSQAYNASAAKIFELIKTGTLFELTGANEIHFDFWEGGAFNLHFNNRGEISGAILQIIPDEKIILNWNVTGFAREPEQNTKVTISILQEKTTTVSVEHTGIKSTEAAAAKKKSWTEILNDFASKVEQGIVEHPN